MRNCIFLILAAFGVGLATAVAQQFQAAPEYAITSGGTPTSLAAGDFKGDGAGDDMAVVDTTGTVSIFLNKRDGSATFSAPSTVSITGDTAPYFIATGTFTQSGQGWKDLVVADSVGHVTVLSSSNGVFAITDQKQVPGIALTSMIAIDVNGDGLSDVEVGDANTAAIWILAGSGSGKLQTAVGPFSSGLVGSQAIFLAAGDFVNAPELVPDLAAVTQDGNAAALQNVTSGPTINFSPGIVVSPTNAGCFTNSQPPVTAAVAGYFEQPIGNAAGFADLAIASIPPTSAACPPAINILANQGPPPPFFFGSYYGIEPAAVGLTPVALAVADVNADQAPDIVMANQGDNSASVLINDGTGGSTFCLNTNSCMSSPGNPVGQEFGTGSNPVAVVAGNFHLGAKQPFPDVAAAHESDKAGNAVTVLSNLGTGTDGLGFVIWLGFAASCTYDSQGQSCTNSIKQARTDYVIAQGQAPTALSVSNFYSLASSQLPDLAIASQSAPVLFQSDAITLFQNDCTQLSAPPCIKGNFTGIVPLSFFGSGNFLSMTAADFVGSGYSSIAAMDDTGTLNVFLNSGVTVGIGPTAQYPITSATSTSVASGIFISGHARNQQDLTVADSQGNITVVSNNNDGSGNFTPLPPNPVSASFSSMVAADLNGDGNTDVVAADANTGAVWVFQGPVNPSSGAFANSFQVTTNLPTQRQPVSIALAFNQNQAPVYLVAVSLDGTISLLANTSSGSTISFATPVVYPPSSTGIPGGATAVTTGDFNVDGAVDVAVASAAQGSLPTVWFFPNTSSGGTLSLGVAESFLTASTPVALAAADINQDGIPDLVIVNQGSNTASILISNGNSGGGGKMSVSVSLTSSLNPSGLGQAITFTATVTSSGSGAPTGTVQFLDGGTVLGTSPLNGGSAVFTTSTLAAGTHAITAAYSGDVYFNPGNSAPVTQVVAGGGKMSVSVGLTSSLNPSGLGQAITFTATVTSYSGSGAPTGTVQFLDGGTVLGTSPLNGGSAVFTTSALATGTDTITAAYSGDVNFNPRTSAPVTQVVAAAPDFVLTISPAGATLAAGNSANFTVKVTPQNSFTGAITMSCGWTTGRPNGAGCQLSSTTLTMNAGGTSAADTLTVSTVSGSLASTYPRKGRPFHPIYAFCFSLAAMALTGMRVSPGRRCRRLRFCFLALLAGCWLGSVACGGGSSTTVNPAGGTPAGTYTVTVTASASGSTGTIQHSSAVNVTVQ